MSNTTINRASLAAMVAGVAATLSLQGITVPKPGGMLQAGTILIYSTEGVETPWTIDSAAVDTTLGGRSNCTRLKMRLSRTSPQITRDYCADSATLYTWHETGKMMRESRPLGANGTLSIKSGTSSTIFEVGTPTTEKIGGVNVYVLPTVVTTRDANGRIIRRLTENFAPGLLTATRGTFEIPDSVRAGEWVVQRRFELIGITGSKP